MKPQTLSARNTAWLVLNQCNIARHDASEWLHDLLPKTDRPAQATDIVYGVLRNRLALDTVLKKCGHIDPQRVKPSVWNLLRIGAYELVYAPNTAEHGIINEAANLARQKTGQRTVGFVNAVLRAVQKHILSRQASPAQTSPQNGIPQDGHHVCLFRQAILPDPADDAVNYYSTAYSLPTWLVAEWLRFYGSEETARICRASNRHPSVIAQPNTCCTTAEQLAARLAEEGIDYELNAQKTMLRLPHGGQVTKMQAFLDGTFYIQDPTAADAVKLPVPEPGWTVADVCAAPGGKSIAMAMLMNDTGTILASDSDAGRLQKVQQNIQRLRLNCIEIVRHGRIEAKIKKLNHLDAVVLDVPCSNTGVLARRVEARWRLQKNDIQTLCDTQQQLLAHAAGLCQPKTHIVYSTCSIQPQENQQQIQQFLKQCPAFRLIAEKITLPALRTEKLFDHDGGYVATLVRK